MVLSTSNLVSFRLYFVSICFFKFYSILKQSFVCTSHITFLLAALSNSWYLVRHILSASDYVLYQRSLTMLKKRKFIALEVHVSNLNLSVLALCSGDRFICVSFTEAIFARFCNIERPKSAVTEGKFYVFTCNASFLRGLYQAPVVYSGRIYLIGMFSFLTNSDAVNCFFGTCLYRMI